MSHRFTNKDVVESINGFTEQIGKLRADIASQIRDEVGTLFQEALLVNIRQIIGPLVKEIVTAILPELTSSITALLSRSLDNIHASQPVNCATTPNQPHPPAAEDLAGSAQLSAKADGEGEKLRNCSVVFLRIPESLVEKPRDRNKADRDTVLDILDDIGVDGVPVNVFRMGVFNAGRWRPVKVVFSNPHDASQVIRNSPRLKSSRFKDIYVRRSMTPSELAEHRRLRLQLKEARKTNPNVVIFKNSIYDRSELPRSPTFSRSELSSASGSRVPSRRSELPRNSPSGRSAPPPGPSF